MTPLQYLTRVGLRLPAKVRGMLWIVVAGLLFTVFTATIRHAARELPPIETAFLRYALGLFSLLPFFFRRGLGLLKSERYLLQISRGVVHGFAVLFWFIAIAFLPIAEVMALGFLAPIFVTIGAFVFLGERVRIRRILAIAVGLLGVLTILRPGLAVIHPGAIAMLVAVPLFATSKLMTKALARTEDASSIVAYLNIFGTIAILIPALMVWRSPTIEELAWITFCAAVATASNMAMIRGLKLIDLTLMQSVEFLQLIWATLAGFYFFDEEPSIWVFLGGTIIVASATYIAHRESRGKVPPPGRLANS